MFATKIVPGRPRFYGYEYPPFPSGSLHMGHVRNYTIGDTLARYKRLRGFNVLYVQAFDSLGLPVEDAAAKTGKSPAEWLDECIARMTGELLRLGLSYDRAKFFSYHDPDYYKWTQWLFLKLYEAGAIYRSENWTDWCEDCQTAVAFEQIVDGCCWRCGTETVQKQMPQWYIDIKGIAQELLDGLEGLDFPADAEQRQRSWIGKTPGLYVTFDVDGLDLKLDVFATQVATIYGTTFLAVAPEHPRLADLVHGTVGESHVLEAAQEMCTIPRVERMKAPGEPGARLERKAVHPLTGETIPIYLAPYVPGDVDTGVALGCPAHDMSSFRFARTMEIPSVQVIAPPGGASEDRDEVYTGDGRLLNSGPHTGLDRAAAEQAIADDLIARGAARRDASLRVRDWCISRQRYWSAPIPIVYCDACGTVPVPEDDLPVILPTEGVALDVAGNPLEHHEPFMAVACPNCGAAARREASTLDTFVNSSFSYMRNCNPDYSEGMFDPEAVDYWIPCDLDIGGKENITVANFPFRAILNWLHRLGLSRKPEPYKGSLFHGLVLKDGHKMSKSLGNIIQPGDLIDDYGADAVRFQSMWAARPDNDYNWSDEKAAAARRFLNGVWNTGIEIVEMVGPAAAAGPDLDRLTKAEQKFARSVEIGSSKIESSYDRIELQAVCNDLIMLWDKIRRFWSRAQAHPTPSNQRLLRRALSNFLIMLNPISPHITEELWHRLGNQQMLAEQTDWIDGHNTP